MDLCKWSELLGKPDSGFHTHFYGVAIGDVIAMIVLMIVISKYTGWKQRDVLIGLLMAAILSHTALCVPAWLSL